uniref:NADPH-dependent diflavin oxidoreductase 1 n=1 Tax=Angiostrongylus cantonensis TaxID=6313 RepID=A0A158P8B9_ANGCA
MHSLLFLYGSETGTAQDIAGCLWKEARLLNVPARLYGLDEYDIEVLPVECMAVFVVATAGQGEIPPNMRKAWSTLLRKSLGRDWMQNVRFAVLGLGDSSYQKFNFASKKVYRRLLQLGGKCLLDIGLADDQHELGIDGTFIPWKKEFWEKLRSTHLFEVKLQNLFLCTIFYCYLLPSKQSTSTQEFYKSFNMKCLLLFILLSYVALFIMIHTIVWKHYSNCLSSYEPGDVLMVQPFNLFESVQIALEALKYPEDLLDRTLRLVPSDEFVKLPPSWLIGCRTSLRTCFMRLFDLQMIPRKSFFQTLASISTDSTEKAKLLEFISPEGLDDFLDYTTRSRRTTAEVLRDFPKTSLAIPPERLFDLFTTIRPRAFSIASAPSPDVIQILVAKVEYRSRMSDVRRGLCSSFLSNTSPEDKVFVKIRSGTFKFPKADVPVICVGPGTGVAPFRSYLAWRSSAANSILFFGCRGKELDFYFKNEWNNLSTTQVVTAFSRDTVGQKVYVQHLMLKHADDVWNIIGEQNGFVFIAGSAGDMPREVGAALDKIAAERGRVQYETWS